MAQVLEESTEEQGVPRHLVEGAAGCKYLYLWLDCDREGEHCAGGTAPQKGFA